LVSWTLPVDKVGDGETEFEFCCWAALLATPLTEQGGLDGGLAWILWLPTGLEDMSIRGKSMGEVELDEWAGRVVVVVGSTSLVATSMSMPAGDVTTAYGLWNRMECFGEDGWLRLPLLSSTMDEWSCRCNNVYRDTISAMTTTVLTMN
jgi:hypothetical protein